MFPGFLKSLASFFLLVFKSGLARFWFLGCCGPMARLNARFAPIFGSLNLSGFLTGIDPPALSGLLSRHGFLINIGSLLPTGFLRLTGSLAVPGFLT